VNNGRLVIAGMIGVCLLAGCGDSPTRQAEKRVMDQIDRAERLCTRAQGMLRDVLFHVNDQPAPLFDLLKEGTPVVPKLKPEMVDQLNPQAVTALAEARKILTGAVKESDAPNAVLALAHESLARVRTLQGACEEHKANVLLVKIALAVGRVRDQIPVVAAHLDVQGYVTKLAGGATDQVAPQIQKILGEIKAEIAALQAKVKTAQAEKTRLETLHAKLAKDTADLAAALGDLGQKKALAKSDTRIAVIAEIATKEIAAEKTTLRTKETEVALADVKASLASLDVQVKAADARQKMMEAVEAELKTIGGTRDRTKTMVANLTAAATKGIVEKVTAIAKDWVELAAVEQAARACYDGAAALLKKARSLAGTAHKGASFPAGQGRAWMASARVDVAPLGQQQTNAALAKSLRDLWRGLSRVQGGAEAALPAALAEALNAIETFPPPEGDDKPLTPAAKRTAAARKYTAAARAYQDAVAAGVPTLAWVDRGHLACARYLYAIHMYAAASDPANTDQGEAKRLKADALQSLKLAQMEIQAALADKRESPHVGSLKAVEERLTFGKYAFVTVKDVGPGGQMVGTDGAANGTFFRELGSGRTTKDLPGTVFVFGADLGERKAGEIVLKVDQGQYMPPPEGLELTIPAEMTVRNTTYKANTKIKVASGGLMPGTG